MNSLQSEREVPEVEWSMVGRAGASPPDLRSLIPTVESGMEVRGRRRHLFFEKPEGIASASTLAVRIYNRSHRPVTTSPSTEGLTEALAGLKIKCRL